MTQKNETPVLILSLLVTLALIGGGLWWLGNRFNFGGFGEGGTAVQSGGNGTASRPRSLRDRLSAGERLLVAEGATTAKEAGISALANANYDQAVVELEQHLQERENRNDPEALIYLNNARIGNQPSYTIAVSVPLANSPNPALEILRGVAQAQDEINQAGGINGTPLRVVIASDDNDPNVVEEVAKSLVNDASVLGVVGHFGSEASLAGAAVYEQGGLVMVSPTSTTVQLSNQGSHVFRTVPSDRFTASTLASYMVDSLGQQNAIVYYNSDSDYSTSLKNQFVTALSTGGGQVVEEFDVFASSFNARNTLQQADQRGAEVLVLATNTPTLDQALQVIRENRGQRLILGGDSLYNPRVLEEGQIDAEEMVVAVPWVISPNFRSPFVATSQQLWGGDVNWRTAMAYDAVQVLTEGLRNNPTRQGIQQALANPNFELQGATGTIRFLSSGDRNQPMQLVTVQPGNRSGYGYDFVPVE
jgi:branched-chain amino acid transport system substrate-binding protein